MPTIEEITDEALSKQANVEDEEWDDESDAESDFSDDEEVTEKGLSLREETIWERLAALVDIIPSSTRTRISHTFRTTSAFAFTGAKIFGNIAWVVTTSALLVGLPYALAVEDEGRIIAQERELQSQGGGPMLAGGGLGGLPQGQQQQQAGQVGAKPPGF
ncbi:mitochondrial import translocase, subunit Tom22 [Ceraceosorus guamensis]|uniref:Mitochondrial import translocase, subunit Tom22 n=1 Tax=Ceraceosorus guamensis TaxID=1522189 RepID=A0A316VX99_9BASI|nr:mitochondrial import translocase, subunit Tom22 [Ceraceosorus guamensis]PWN40911.1 mitochondrial import translocase, subunit Tom22 [Ceraceosorus guamensis]